jgi:hypothetical protein
MLKLLHFNSSTGLRRPNGVSCGTCIQVQVQDKKYNEILIDVCRYLLYYRVLSALSIPIILLI